MNQTMLYTNSANSNSEATANPRVAPVVRIALALTALSLGACASYDYALERPLAEDLVGGDESELIGSCDTPHPEILRSVVRVAAGGTGDGSGVVVSQGLVLTAAHVVNESPHHTVDIGNGFQPAALLALDEVADLALLRVDTENLQPIRLSFASLEPTETVWASGFPLALEHVTTSGEFTGTGQSGRLFSSAPINLGVSGGGLLRCVDGEFTLAGMIRGYGAIWKGDQLIHKRDLSISVPAYQIESFIYRNGGASAQVFTN